MMPEPADPLCLRAALPPVACARWLAAVDAAPPPADAADVQATSGSWRLPALGQALFDEVLCTLAQSPVAAELQARLGPRPLCLARQCWLRRQYPAALRPPGQHPHAWHQDGALACRFSPDGEPESLADLVTVWLPLMACGDDAPSLEWVAAPVHERVHGPAHELLRPADLSDDAVARRWGPHGRRHARLQAGDALLFGGALLHRTHVGPWMNRRRVSVELRFLPAGAGPERLAGEERRAWPG